jgi:hypothetical protein
MRIRVTCAKDKAASRKVDGPDAASAGVAMNEAEGLATVSLSWPWSDRFIATRRGGQPQVCFNRENDLVLTPNDAAMAGREIDR